MKWKNEKMCDVCGCEEAEWLKRCADCHIVMCQKCVGASCGYCSDPSDLKKYYCKEHQEETCLHCGEIICEYCENFYPAWCRKCKRGPFHGWFSDADCCLAVHKQQNCGKC
jgi:hypothetical protein